jgi:hypothetical protein
MAAVLVLGGLRMINKQRRVAEAVMVLPGNLLFKAVAVDRGLLIL